MVYCCKCLEGNHSQEWILYPNTVQLILETLITELNWNLCNIKTILLCIGCSDVDNNGKFLTPKSNNVK